MGGSVASIEEGFMQEQIAESAYRYQKEIESSERIIVGVNSFQSENKYDTPVFTIDESIRDIQTVKLRNLKKSRNQQLSSSCLLKLKQTAINGTNLMPVVIDAVENHCTLGEIADVLREVFGEH